MRKFILSLVMAPSVSAMATPFWPWYSDSYKEKLAQHRKKSPMGQIHKRFSIPKSDTMPKPVSIAPNTSHTDVTLRLDDILAHVNKGSRRKKIPGYTIQIHAGNSREYAFALKKRLYTYCINVEATVKYNQPNYLVQVGKFFSKLEAYESYAILARKFLRVIIRPTAFPNKSGMFCNRVLVNTRKRSDRKRSGVL